MSKNRLVGWMAGVAAAALFGGVAMADPIGPFNCPENDSCFGNIFTLSYTAVTPTDYTITLEIDTTNTTLSATDFIAQVAFKVVSSSSDITSATLTSTTAPGSWSAVTIGGLNNGGCTTGNQGFVCTSDGVLALTDGSTYDWIFDVQVGNASDWLLGTMAASVKANYGPANGLLTSEHITLQQTTETTETTETSAVPEPGTMLLLGAALVGFGFARRRQSA